MFNFFNKKEYKNSGDRAEELACQYLLAQGLTLLDRNYLCKGGEIDLIMRDDNYLVFIEVKFRKNSQYGNPAEHVTNSKQRRIIHTARDYLQKHSKLAKLPVRFDVIAIQHQDDINWIKSAFDSSD